MKSVKICAALLLFVSAFFTSCSPDHDYISETNEIITRGNWKVDYFYTTNDKTDQYRDYNFQFSGNGTVECTGANHSCTGTWSTIHDEKGEEVLTIKLAEQSDMAELNNMWQVKGKQLNGLTLSARTASNIQLKLGKQ
jgi:hypothetical protein